MKQNQTSSNRTCMLSGVGAFVETVIFAQDEAWKVPILSFGGTDLGRLSPTSNHLIVGTVRDDGVVLAPNDTHLR